ncbi:MAG: VOC family protein [Parvibaculum sp.]|nr:VOC family protein [Parvibaculum sp.]
MSPHTNDVTAVDHLIVAVRDLAEAEKTYTAIFGRGPSWAGHHPGMGSANVLYRLANTYVELLAPVAEGPTADALNAHLDKAGEGIFGLALGLADADPAHAAFAARGLAGTQPMDGSGTDDRTGATRRWRTIMFPREATNGLFLFAIQHLGPDDALPPAPLSDGVSEAEAVAACDHAVVLTPDAEATKSLFGGKFGIRLALDQTKPEWGVRQLFFRAGGLTLEVVEPLDKEKAPKTERFWGVAWKVPDIAAAVARLAKAGLDVSEVRKGRKPGTEVATIRKPTNGVPTLLICER